VLLIIWTVGAADRVPAWSESLADFVASSPAWVDSLLGLGYLVSLIYALGVTIALILGGPARRPALRDLLIVVVISLGLVLLLSFAVNGEWPYVLPEIDLQDPIPRYPVTRVAMVTGILLVAGAYLTRPLRRFGWLAIATTAIASIALSYGSPIHAIGSLGIGLLAAGSLLAVVGTPRGYPSPDIVRHGLRSLGVDSSEVAPSSKQVWGLVRFEAKDGIGRQLDIKVHGRDSFDSQLAAKVWRTLIYRELGRTVSYSRLQAVEHEALVSLMAERAGVAVPELRAVGNASAEVALIAFETGGVALNSLEASQISDALLVRVWQSVAELHTANITHGSLSTGAVVVSDDEPILVDFGLGSVSPGDDDRAGDTVQLLFSLAAQVGPERAVAAAFRGMGEERLVEALPYLQVPAVNGSIRKLVEDPKALVSSLTEAIVTKAGVERPAPVELRRVTWQSLAVVVLLLLVAFAVIPLLFEIDYAQIWDVLQAADWALIALAGIIGQAQFFPSATATMFAVPAALPFWPLVTLQTASQFISLAIPSSAGRVAMNAAFLHKFGVSVTVALAQGAIDGFSGFLVQAAILIVVLLTGNVDLGLEIDPSDVPWLIILAIVVGLIVLAVVVILRVEKLREKVVPILSQAWGALMVVLRQPSRALGLLGSNFVYWNTLGLTLFVLLEAVGSPVSYGEALFVAAGTSLLAGFMPVPGGVGVAEATMVALLATFGVDQSVALAVTAVYRVATFYLPALEGMFGTRWLRRNDYI